MNPPLENEIAGYLDHGFTKEERAKGLINAILERWRYLRAPH